MTSGLVATALLVGVDALAVVVWVVRVTVRRRNEKV
jgi:hypothetical protein